MMDDDVLTQRDTFRDWHSTSPQSANVGGALVQRLSGVLNARCSAV
jgi:hypothetical protein